MQSDKIKNDKSFNVAYLKRIFDFIKPFKWMLLLQVLLNIVFSALSTLSVTLILPIIKVIFYSEEVLLNTKSTDPISDINTKFFSFVSGLVTGNNDKFTLLFNISLFIIFVFIFKNIFKYLGAIVSVKLEEGIIKSIRDKLFHKIITLPVEFFAKSKQGNLISTITNDVSTINSSTLSTFTTTLREAIQIVLYFALLITISGKLTLIAFSTSIISLLLIKTAIKYLRKYASRMQTAMADYTSTMQETISGIRVVKAYNAQDTAFQKFEGDSAKYVKSAVKLKKITELVPSVNEVFAISALSVVLIVGGTEVLNGTMKPENLMLFLFSLFSIMSPISTVVNSISRFQHGFVAAQRVFSILDEKPKIISGTKKFGPFNNSIKIKNISFAYNDSNVIDDVSLELKKSKKIAFVGASGSGKSTMLDLLIRFYDPNKGLIEIDDIDIKEYNVRSYRELFGMVGQENMLFNDTIANNIRYGYKEATEKDIEEAAKNANAYNFIMNTPNGFDTVIGDRGVNLSGGERQRIAIARALVRNPQILIFDEATSALDAESEKVVQEAINKSLENKTAVIVAHRLSTIIDCDQIYVFDKGKIAEFGTHIDLISNDGIYKKLYDIQFDKSSIKLIT